MGKGSGSGSGSGYYMKGGHAAPPLSGTIATVGPKRQSRQRPGRLQYPLPPSAAVNVRREYYFVSPDDDSSDDSPDFTTHHWKNHFPPMNNEHTLRPKGFENVGNTCYANAALQCLFSTALTQALMDPNAVHIFRRYSFNLQILRKGSGSVDSEDVDEDDIKKPLEQEDDILSVPSSERTKIQDKAAKRKVKREAKQKEREEKDMQDKCQWLTRELRSITLEYQSASIGSTRSSASSMSFSEWFTGPPPPVVDPGSVTRHPQRLSMSLRPYQQEDAHEFLRALLGTLVMNGRNRELSSLFDGLLESSVTCQSCGRPSLTRDRYMDLSLDIYGHHIKSLNDALAEFTKTETLSDDNKVYCNKCEEKCEATKGLRLATAPSILVCHLKRFAFNNTGGLVRLSKHVECPLEIEIGDYMSNLNQSRPPSYELVAMLVHQGQSCEYGHYVAYVKNNGQWFCCNDRDISPVDVSLVMSQQAYIVMYEVARMREKHGYPSPSGSRKGSNPRQATDFLGMLCSVNESMLRDLCFGGTSNVKSTAVRYPRGGSQASSDGVRLPRSSSKPPVDGAGRRHRNHHRTSVGAYIDDDHSSLSGAGSTTFEAASARSWRRAASSGNLRAMCDNADSIAGSSGSTPQNNRKSTIAGGPSMPGASIRATGTQSVPRERPTSSNFEASTSSKESTAKESSAAAGNWVKSSSDRPVYSKGDRPPRQQHRRRNSSALRR